MTALLNVLSALSSPARLAALRLLWHAEREICLCEIMDDLHITQARASRHMAVLKQAKLVSSRIEGKWCFYTRNPDLSKSSVRIIEKLLELVPQGEIVPSAKQHLTKKGCRKV